MRGAVVRTCYGPLMAKFEPRDPFRTPGGFLPVSDFESGGLSDPAFERHYAGLPKLDELPEAPTVRPVHWWQVLIAALLALLILGLLFAPEALLATVAR